LQNGVALTFPSRIIARKQLSSLQIKFLTSNSGAALEDPESPVGITSFPEGAVDGEMVEVRLAGMVPFKYPVGLGTKQEHAELIPEIGFGVHIEA